MDTTDILLTIIIILIFIGLYFLNILGVGVQHIKDNWSIYRCNPMIMPFAGTFGKDVMKNFTFCIQNTQTNYMGELLKPLQYSMSLIGKTGATITKGAQSSRGFLADLRSFIVTIVQDIYSVFLNILIQFQRVSLVMKDLFAKMSGIMGTYLYILSGSVLTIQDAWSGEPGNLVRKLNDPAITMDACFHPDTLVRKSNGKTIKMKNIKLGDKLKNGQIVYAKLVIHNLDENNNYMEKFYSLKDGETGAPILVTGSHLIFDKSINNFIAVKDYATDVSSVDSNKLVCLITNDHTIPLGKYIFHDWEDNNDIIKNN
jgi:hypothetical protein